MVGVYKGQNNHQTSAIWPIVSATVWRSAIGQLFCTQAEGANVNLNATNQRRRNTYDRMWLLVLWCNWDTHTQHWVWNICGYQAEVILICIQQHQSGMSWNDVHRSQYGQIFIKCNKNRYSDKSLCCLSILKSVTDFPKADTHSIYPVWNCHHQAENPATLSLLREVHDRNPQCLTFPTKH